MKQRKPVFEIVLILIIIILLWIFSKTMRFSPVGGSSQNLSTFTQPSSSSSSVSVGSTPVTMSSQVYQFAQGGQVAIGIPVTWSIQKHTDTDADHIEFYGPEGSILISKGQGFGGASPCQTIETVVIKNNTFQATSCLVVQTDTGEQIKNLSMSKPLNNSQSYQIVVNINSPSVNEVRVKNILNTLEL